MAEISARFCNHYTESRLWTIMDVGRDPNAPLELFTGYLGPGECTDQLTFYSADGTYGRMRYWRSDSAPEEDDVVNGARVEMY